MRGSNFIFDYISEICYLCQKISINRGGSYIASARWISNKKATMNSKINNDDKWLH